MKKALLFSVIAFAMLFLASCGHNLGLVGVGTGWRLGNGEYGFAYGEGLFGTFVTKDGIHFKAELDSTNGFTYDPSSNTYKGIRSIEYSLPPQITGYAVDFAKENPEVAKAYYEALVKYFEIKKETVETGKTGLISDEKSKSATEQAAEILKKAVEQYGKIVKEKEEQPAQEEKKDDATKEEEKKDDEASSGTEETTAGKNKPISDVAVPSDK